MLTKHTIALLTLGGIVVAERIYPAPHRYCVRTPELPDVPLSDDDVIALLAAKRISPPPAREIGDVYVYQLSDEAWARTSALKDFTFGFGRCDVCGTAPIGLAANGKAARHGHTKETPACEGSGKPLAIMVLHGTPSDQVLEPVARVA